jgi:MFS family permease
LTAKEKKILLVTSFGHFMSHYNMLVFPALVLPLTKSLHLEMAAVLGLSFWQYLLFGLTALPWGIIGDRWSNSNLMALMFLGSGISGLVAGLSTDDPLILSVSLAGIGLFSGIYHPIGLGLISKGIERLTMAMGYNAMFGGLGLVAAPIVTGLVNWLSGPGAAYLFLSALNLAGFVFALKLHDRSSGHSEPQKKVEGENRSLYPFLVLLLAMMLGGIAYRGATVILPAYIELKSSGIFESLSGMIGVRLSDNLVATAITSVIYLVGVVGQYTGGVVGERRDNRFAYLIFHTICVPAAFMMAFASNLGLVGLAFIYFFFLLGMQPIENTLVARITPKRLHHSAFGMKFILTFGVGALAVKLMEHVEATYGVEASFITLGLTSILLVLSIIGLIMVTRRFPPYGKG